MKINDEDEGGDWTFCAGRPRGHERFGSCQQGSSVTFTKDFHYIVFGAPGAFNWKGGVRGGEKRSSKDLEENGLERRGEKTRSREQKSGRMKRNGWRGEKRRSLDQEEK